MSNCPARIHNIERNPETEYFPSNILFSDNSVIDKMSREHYSQHLQAMAEPILAFIQDEAKEAYRFLWLRSFHSPLAIRIENNELGYFIITKELKGMEGYYPKGIAKQSSNKLTAKQYKQVISLIEKSHFWQSLTFRSDLGLVLDGAEWVLEGYHEQNIM